MKWYKDPLTILLIITPVIIASSILGIVSILKVLVNK